MRTSNFRVEDRKIITENIEKLIGYVNQDVFAVNFADEEWQGLYKTMKLIRQDGAIVHIPADMNGNFPLVKECYVEGTSKLGFFGTLNANDPEDMSIASTDYINIYFHPRAYVEGEAGVPINQPTPTAWDIIIGQMEDIKQDITEMKAELDADVEEVERKLENGDFDAKINGVNTLTMVAGQGINLDQQGSTLTISTDSEVNKIEKIKVNNVEQPIVEKTVNITVPTKTSDISNDSGFITNEVNNLVNYELKAGVGHSISLSINSQTYVMTMSLLNSAGTILNTQTVDLPLESMVVNGSYDSETKEVVLTLNNGNTIRFSVADLVSGLQSEITNDNKLASDLVDDSNSDNKFVTTSEKTTWNGKYDKPSGGIPKADLDNAVQTSLGKADTALQEHQDISGKEDKSNKVTTIDENSTDTQYPGAKLLYDKLAEKQAEIDLLESQIPTRTTSDTQLTDSSNLSAKSNYVGADNISQIQYKEATYIESSGTQYINTGVQMSNVTKVEIDAQLVSLASGATSPAFVGGRWNTSNGFQLIYNSSTRVISGRWKENSYTVEYTDYSRFTASLSTTEFIVNGTTLGSYTSTAVSDTLPLLLFARYKDTSGSTIRDYSNSKLYSCKIYNGETLLRDFIPAQDVSDNSYGLFDKVEQKFYKNAGTGSFSGSATNNYISPSPSYPQDVKVFSGNVSVGIEPDNLLRLGTALNGYVNASTMKFQVGASATGYYFKTIDLPDTITFTATNGNRANISYFNQTPANNVSCALNDTSNDLPRTIVVNKNYQYIHIQFGFSATGISNLQVQKGTAILQAQTYPLTLGNIYLVDLDTAKNLIFKNEVGSPYYKSTLTEGAFYWHKEINTITYDGSENWNLSEVSGYSTTRFRTEATLSPTGVAYQALFNNFINRTGDVQDREEGYCRGDYIYISINRDRLSENTATAFKTWLSTHNTDVYYAMATPTYTEITDSTLLTQLNNLWNNLKTYKNITNIAITGGDIAGELNLTYKQDLQTLFNNITNAIISLGNNT